MLHGLIEHLLPGRSPRRARDLANSGRRTTGELVGIRIRIGKDDSPDRHEFAVLVDGHRRGVRQRLDPEFLGRIRLGAVLHVLVDDDGGVLIEEGQDLSSVAVIHRAIDPPPDGIDDERHDLNRERRKALPAQIAVRRVTRGSVLGAASGLDLEVEVAPSGEDRFAQTLRRQQVPFYASHLVAAGTVMPGTARHGRGKVRIDWPAAATASPGVGVGPAATPGGEDAAAGLGGPAPEWAPAAPMVAGDGERHGGITFDQWVSVSAGLVRDRVRPADHDDYARAQGVAQGTWPSAAAAWQAQLRRDPRLGARFGAAYQQAVKNG